MVVKAPAAPKKLPERIAPAADNAEPTVATQAAPRTEEETPLLPLPPFEALALAWDEEPPRLFCGPAGAFCVSACNFDPLEQFSV
jgi:hypothetical protein